MSASPSASARTKNLRKIDETLSNGACALSPCWRHRVLSGEILSMENHQREPLDACLAEVIVLEIGTGQLVLVELFASQPDNLVRSSAVLELCHIKIVHRVS